MSDLSPIEIRVDELPTMFWQSAFCPTCGAAIGEYCLYPSGRRAHTRHAERDELILKVSATAVVVAAINRVSEARR